MNNNHFSPLIKALLKEQKKRGLNQAQLAELLGLSEATVSLIKAGKRHIGVNSITRIASTFPELRPLIAEILQVPSK